MAKLTKSIYAVRPGNVYPETIEAGEDVDGRLEEIAKACGALATKASKGAPKNK